MGAYFETAAVALGIYTVRGLVHPSSSGKPAVRHQTGQALGWLEHPFDLL